MDAVQNRQSFCFDSFDSRPICRPTLFYSTNHIAAQERNKCLASSILICIQQIPALFSFPPPSAVVVVARRKERNVYMYVSPPSGCVESSRYPLPKRDAL